MPRSWKLKSPGRRKTPNSTERGLLRRAWEGPARVRLKMSGREQGRRPAGWGPQHAPRAGSGDPVWSHAAVLGSV